MTRKSKIGWGLALAVVLLTACDGGAPSSTPPETGDVAAAYVGDSTIWVSDVKREAVAQGLIGDGEPLEVTSDLFRQVLESVIDQKLLAAEARRRGLDNDRSAKHRLEMAQDRVLGDLLLERSLQGAVSEASIQAIYNETRIATEAGEQVRARQIVTANEADAQAVKGLIAAGANFESLVLTRSVDAGTRFSEGDLGYASLDLMPEAYAQALATAKAGEIVGPFQSDDSWVLLKVEDRRPEEPISLDAARPQIVKFLTYSAVRDILTNLREGARIELLVPETPADAAPEPANAPPGALEAPPAQSATETPNAAPKTP